MRSHEIRRRFLDHFTATGHVQLPSGSLVPPDWDRSVLITTAGMQPLKRYFLGLDEPPQARLMTVQKCFRTVDIDEVGRTAHHLTFFEMLGNFSIGDYFKQFAVEQAWELVTSPDGFGFDPDRLWATVYRGDGDVPADEEAIALWLEVGVPPERILRLGGDNFWQAGPVGPCGPCSELHYDRGAEFGCGRAECGPDCDCDRFIEFWNLVFMQYNMLDDGSLEPLPRPSIDTGAGLERVTMLAQGVDSAYLTDAFGDVIEVIEGWSGARYGHTPEETKALKVLADHGRAMSFLATDGIEPWQRGPRLRAAPGHPPRRPARPPDRARGRVPRPAARPRRRAAGRGPPRARRRGGRGSRRCSPPRRSASRARSRPAGSCSTTSSPGRRREVGCRRRVPAARHLRLPDRAHGRDRRRARKDASTRPGSPTLMDEQRDRARAATAGGRVDASELASDFADRVRRLRAARRDDAGGRGPRARRRHGARQAARVAVLRPRAAARSPTAAGSRPTRPAPPSRTSSASTTTRSIVARLEHGELHPGERVRAHVDAEARRPTMANHTATHLLHAALREPCSATTSTQAGSYVGPDKLRFDFRHCGAAQRRGARPTSSGS